MEDNDGAIIGEYQAVSAQVESRKRLLEIQEQQRRAEAEAAASEARRVKALAEARLAEEKAASEKAAREQKEAELQRERALREELEHKWNQDITARMKVKAMLELALVDVLGGAGIQDPKMKKCIEVARSIAADFDALFAELAKFHEVMNDYEAKVQKFQDRFWELLITSQEMNKALEQPESQPHNDL